MPIDKRFCNRFVIAIAKGLVYNISNLIVGGKI